MLRSASSILEPIFAWSSETQEKMALIFQTARGKLEKMTYAELREAVENRSERLQTLAPHSRVGLIAPHGPAFLVDALSILHAGHCLVPINGQIPSADRAELAERSGIHALSEYGKPELRLCSGASIDLADDADYRSVGPAYLRFTSGSTGRRKGVLLGHRTILERTAAANARLQISPRDRVLCLLPMVDHLVVSILLYLRYGATVLLVERDEDAAILAKSQRASVLYGAPAQFISFLQPLPDLRLAVSTTQGLSESIAAQFLENTGQPLTQALGIIEAGLLTLNDLRARSEPLLAGQPMPDYQISVVGDKARSGEIHVTGPGLLDAYVAPWRSRSALLGPHGFPTGDHGWLDETGCLHLVGRENNRIEIDGVTYFSEELEAIINQHPEVVESLVFSKNGRLICEVVASADSAITLWISKKISVAEIRFVTELPRTATGKIARPTSSPKAEVPDESAR